MYEEHNLKAILSLSSIAVLILSISASVSLFIATFNLSIYDDALAFPPTPINQTTDNASAIAPLDGSASKGPDVEPPPSPPEQPLVVDNQTGIVITDKTGEYQFVRKWGSGGKGNGQFASSLDKGPWGISLDSAGNVYVADTYNDRIQKFDSDGNFITKWGSTCNFFPPGCDTNAPGAKLPGDGQFNDPWGISLDSSDNVYVADFGNSRIQKFDSNGNFIIGWGFNCDLELELGCDIQSPGAVEPGDGQFEVPVDVAIDNSGNVYVADFGNKRIQKFDSNGTYLAKWGSNGTNDGQFYDLGGLAADSAGNVYVTDSSNQRIQKFDSNGNFILGWGSRGTGDGQFGDSTNYEHGPYGIAVDSSDNVYIADYSNARIQKFDSNGNFITKWGSNGTSDGQFSFPTDVAVDSSGNVYVVDSENYRIQVFAPIGLAPPSEVPEQSSSASNQSSDVMINGTATTIREPTIEYQLVNKWGSEGTDDGQFNDSSGIVVDSSGNVYIGDYLNSNIQKFDSDGNFITKWGSYCDIVLGYGECNTDAPGAKDLGDGQFNLPENIAIDSDNNIYVADSLNSRIQKFDSNGNFITKWGSEGSDNGQFNWAESVAVDPKNQVYVADNNIRIQKFDSDGNFINKLNSSGNANFELYVPMEISVDSSGNVYVVSSNNRVHKFDSNGNFITKWGSEGTGDGQFNGSAQLAIDTFGYVYVSDYYNNRIQKFDSDGNFITKWGSEGTNDGQFEGPDVIAIDSAGKIYVDDSGNNRIQVFAPSEVITTSTNSSFEQNPEVSNLSEVSSYLR